ncbi:MAG: hypothetical protein JKY37_21525, partial [Nannocystaceae bacterium]|nr:hypothetical protein [Nannocystaceae bacterium]
GPPYFSASNNAIGTWGICTRTADLAPDSTLSEPAALGCPLPCNPKWDPGQVGLVCGTQRACCQTHELQPADCVLDAVTGLWRGVNGHDIGLSTDWSQSAHATHQDPDGLGCAMLANGDITSARFVDCVRQLSVADRRGQCTTLAPDQVCPHAQVAYIDACEAMNG